MNAKKVHIRKRIEQVQRYIEENLDTPVTLEMLAEQCGYSTLYFHSIFTGMVGEGVKEYQRRLCLQRAARQLLLTDKSIMNIALEAGYESQEGFSRAFKKRFDFPPLKFRKLQPQYNTLSGGKLMNTTTLPTSDLTVTIKNCTPITVAAVRHTGPYANCKNAFKTLHKWSRANGLYGTYRPVVGVSYDDPRTTPQEKLRYDACMAIPENFVVTGEARKYVIHGGRYACCIHKGSYATMPQTFTAILGHWLPDSGEELTNHPPLEVYLNCPSVTAEAELRTEIRIPFK
ncbi:GyrI-like domain-containing protein [Halodesulfovibrio sp.]|jgi:AraC family transcriptional regulator|uniref:AraC family transcriptional regulator n=1 Tax=Halodesulfovibrio sp. TaxID=1912772 RepID=UPI0025EDBCF9|nr:AraC family transcriptional regulator [Halodesulfovibrio sp.]MCT4535380.1 AraC family transcriptional regulator [Halodesulfovibrio sp.]